MIIIIRACPSEERMMETMNPPQVGMRLRTKERKRKKRGKEKKIRKKKKRKKKNEKIK